MRRVPMSMTTTNRIVNIHQLGMHNIVALSPIIDQGVSDTVNQICNYCILDKNNIGDKVSSNRGNFNVHLPNLKFNVKFLYLFFTLPSFTAISPTGRYLVH